MKRKAMKLWVVKMKDGEYVRDDTGSIILLDKRPRRNWVDDIRCDSSERYVRVELREVK